MAVLSAPSANGLMRNDDPAIEHHFLDIAQAQIEAEVEPNSAGHDSDRPLA
ncbi:hypothetical protein GGE50_006839 [Rhizobium leguminosarum]|jgi:hypothetical protein|nr:hypothetical protein [Rhizobium leguminosarum]MDH6663917.1 hypothetical protein [Rhizobium sophorae]MBB4345833.1 hypothetical protein [Rhizobium leguminosarum]MBB4358177.1 hypothetical protein [Rhizobium leguminosarum]MBB4390808.1 hypothetical protein [Rhizobium leguminosarum]